jgi:hypothetical protein
VENLFSAGFGAGFFRCGYLRYSCGTVRIYGMYGMMRVAGKKEIKYGVFRYQDMLLMLGSEGFMPDT